MSILNNVSEQEVLSIISGQGDQEPIRYRWECVLSTPDGDITAHKVSSVYIMRDYLSNFADEMRIDLYVSPGEFEKIVFPHRDNFEAVVTRVPVMVDSDGHQILDKAKSEVKRYRAVMDEARSQQMEGLVQSDAVYEDMDRKDIRPLTLTLMDKGIEQIRTLACGGVFHNTTPTNLLRFLFSSLSRQLDVDDADAVRGVDVVEDTSMAKPIEQVAIPHMTLLKDVPAYLQIGHGVYTTGINRYLQNRIWYIYPLYDKKRFETATRKLTLLNLPENMMRGFKKTSRYVDGHLYVVSTEETKTQDISNIRQLNEGNGQRYLDATKLFNGMVATGDNKARLKRQDNMAEYISTTRNTGVNYAPLSDLPITASHAFQMSKMALKEGVITQAGWEASEPKYITPGMPVRFLMPINGILKERFGSVIGVETNVMSDSQGILNTSHTSKSAVTLFLEPDKPAQSNP